MEQVEFPNGGNLYFGNGELYVADRSGANAWGERFVGNVTAADLTVGGTPFVKRSRVNKQRGIIKQKTLTKDIKFTFTADEATFDNLRRHTLSTEFADTQAADDGTLTLAADSWVYDLWYELGKRSLSSVTVTHTVIVDEAPTTVPLTLDVDYALDVETGRIKLITGGAAVEGEEISVAADWAVIAKRKLAIGTDSDSECKIRFRGDPTDGPAFDVVLHKVFLRPNGATGFIQEGDDPASYVFEGTVGDDSENNPDDPFGLIYAK